MSEHSTKVKKTLKADLLDALDDAIELAVDFKRPVTEDNLRRVRTRLIATIIRGADYIEPKEKE